MGRIASDASFGRSRERSLPAAQRAALRALIGLRRRDGTRDLRFHERSGSDATMMQQVPLGYMHHRCV
jgi:hypothetical protein